MGLAQFVSIVRIFGGGASDEAERQSLFKEALLLTLARATSSDVNIRPAEVATVRKIMKSVVDEDVSEADVRVAAGSELYERASLDDYLSAIGRKLSPRDRATLVQSLAQVIRSDRRISPKEVEFFDRVVSAVRATPSEIAGLLEEG
jgi:uncharacterized tellurite resistance protein B-like protein